MQEIQLRFVNCILYFCLLILWLGKNEKLLRTHALYTRLKSDMVYFVCCDLRRMLLLYMWVFSCVHLHLIYLSCIFLSVCVTNTGDLYLFLDKD